MPKVKHMSISYTALHAWRKSPRKFLYEYVYALRPKSQPLTPAFDKSGGALEFGVCVHKFLELWDGPATFDPALNAALVEAPLPMVGPRSQDHLRQLAALYVEKFKPFNGSRELELKFPLNDRVDFVAHLDCLDTDYNQVVDYKTTSKHLFYDWHPTIAPNQQAIGYIVAARMAGYSVRSCLFRGISTDHKLLDKSYVPKRRSGGMGERPPLFMDYEYAPSEAEVAQWGTQTAKDVARLIEDIESEAYTCHCSVGDYCNYRQVCLTQPDERDIVISNSFTIGDFRGFSLTLEGEQ